MVCKSIVFTFCLTLQVPISQNDTLKQFVGKLPTHCLSVFDHFVGLGLSDLYDNIHTVLGFYKNNFTARTTQE